LNPDDLLDQGLNGLPLHRQNHLEQNSKLRQSNGWCFFSHPDFKVPEEKTRWHQNGQPTGRHTEIAAYLNPQEEHPTP
jgi:hypothetical protein